METCWGPLVIFPSRRIDSISLSVFLFLSVSDGVIRSSWLWAAKVCHYCGWMPVVMTLWRLNNCVRTAGYVSPWLTTLESSATWIDSCWFITHWLKMERADWLSAISCSVTSLSPVQSWEVTGINWPTTTSIKTTESSPIHPSIHPSIQQVPSVIRCHGIRTWRAAWEIWPAICPDVLLDWSIEMWFISRRLVRQNAKRIVIIGRLMAIHCRRCQLQPVTNRKSPCAFITNHARLCWLHHLRVFCSLTSVNETDGHNHSNCSFKWTQRRCKASNVDATGPGLGFRL